MIYDIAEFDKIDFKYILQYIQYISEKYNDEDLMILLERYHENTTLKEEDKNNWKPYMYGIVAGLQHKHQEPFEILLRKEKLLQIKKASI